MRNTIKNTISIKKFRFDVTDSTNTQAKLLLKHQSPPFFVLANTQTSGRGRIGNIWQSSEPSLYFTAVISEKKCSYKIEHYPYLSGLIIYEFIEKLNIGNISLKWPNDLLVSGKKIAGILIEKQKENLIIGIGINLNQDSSFFEENELNGTSLFLEKKEKIDLEEFQNNFSSFFFEKLEENQKNKDKIFENWQNKSAHINQNIRCRYGKNIEYGKFIGLSGSGSLILETEKGRKEIIAGEILE